MIMTALLPVATLVVVVKTAILLLGGLITYMAFKAYRRTGSKSLRALSIGFGFVTFGSLVGGMVHQITNVGLASSVLVESSLVMVGLLIITYSLYTD
ncbi:MAG: hypothetical protein SXQ77_07715 [Halobacteria archaeon]|nr:hypothetical protein [Halobacteria archaeon]